MRVFLVTYVEISSPYRICLTLEQAKMTLMEMISGHVPYEGDDEWGGWDWWQIEEDKVHCFGDIDQEPLYEDAPKIAEGTVREIEIELPKEMKPEIDFAFKLLDGDKQAVDLFKDIVGA